ncbi:hypothetical protein WR25_27218 isoform B [Diploscapter pachys]|uniref:Uncharacterized protein n=1 Tax=Diploscapter pachys TaxID=2018661 RepID=A0A2A2JS71_9BILA|nr:hypothetical protein WR25_27218 isoform B [Diploscapter pachys]
MVLSPVQNKPKRSKSERRDKPGDDTIKVQIARIIHDMKEMERTRYQRKAKAEPVLNGVVTKPDAAEGKNRSSRRKSIAPVRYTNENADKSEKSPKQKRMSDESVKSTGSKRSRSSKKSPDNSPLSVKVLIETEKPNKSVKMEKSESEETGRAKEAKTENGEANEQSEEMLLNRRGRPRKYGPNREPLEKGRGRPRGTTKEKSNESVKKEKETAVKTEKEKPDKSEKPERKNGSTKRSKPSAMYSDTFELPRKRFSCPIPLSLPGNVKLSNIKHRKDAYRDLKRMLDLVPDESIGAYFEQVRAFSVYLQDVRIFSCDFIHFLHF